MAMVSQTNYILRRLVQPWQIRRVIAERLTEPVHLNLASVAVAALGGFRTKVAFDLVLRRQFAFSILYAADSAVKLGIKRLTLAEFGVANGAGLMNMAFIAQRVTKETGVEFDLYGFDSGSGMPPPIDYRDHPELYQHGDFPIDVERVKQALPSNARLLIGDVAETVPQFCDLLSPDAPLGFVSLDLDYYSSTKAAMAVFEGDANLYLPMTIVYLDDVADDTTNRWVGGLLAVDEFNQENEFRKISPFNMLRQQRIMKNGRWIDQIYCLHVHDHAARSPAIRRERRVIQNEYIGINRDETGYDRTRILGGSGHG